MRKKPCVQVLSCHDENTLRANPVFGRTHLVVMIIITIVSVIIVIIIVIDIIIIVTTIVFSDKLDSPPSGRTSSGTPWDILSLRSS